MVASALRIATEECGGGSAWRRKEIVNANNIGDLRRLIPSGNKSLSDPETLSSPMIDVLLKYSIVIDSEQPASILGQMRLPHDIQIVGVGRSNISSF